MDKDIVRRQYMESQLPNHFERYYRIPGINGKLIKNKNHDIVDGIEFFNEFNDLSLSGIGCTLSHLLSIKTAYDNGEQIACIMEDDVYMNLLNVQDESLDDFVKTINNNLDWEILQLYHSYSDELNKNFIKIKDYTLHLHQKGKDKYPCSCALYIINRKGMEKILSNMGSNPFYFLKNMSVKGVADYIIYDQVKTYTLNPSLVIPNNTDLDSIIHTNHTNDHLKSSFNNLKKYENKIKSIQLKKDIQEYIDLIDKINIKRINKIPVYYINMDKDIVRKQYMESQLPNHFERYYRIPGVNGKLIKNKNHDIVDGIEFFNKFNDNSVSEIGCTLSHLLSIKTAYDNGEQIACIMEDDVYMNLLNIQDKSLDDFVKSLNLDWEILKLYHILNNLLAKNYIKIKDYTLHLEKEVNTFSTACYLINRKGMKKILNSMGSNPFYFLKYMSINCSADQILYDQVKTYNINPPLVITNNTELDSTIHTDHTYGHLKNCFNNLNKYEKKIKVNIIIYIHICQKEGWKKSFSILINSIKNSQLYNEVKEIRLGIINDNGILIEDELLKDKKYKIIYIGKSYEYERPTLLHMKKYSEIDSFNTLYCYLHTKGISHFNTKNENAVLNWIYDMLKHNIYKWKNVIEKLKKYETYGCNYNKIHYSGNFWWSTIKHIKKLPNYIEDYYTAPEDWILINKDNMYCENNCNDNFKSPYPDNFYL
jgi:GR25 family glycosyltransferase involved in LPS biosynthesis